MNQNGNEKHRINGSLDWSLANVDTHQKVDFDFMQRRLLVRQFGYVIVHGSLADALAALIGKRKAFEAGSGSGFLAFALKYRGVDLIASDSKRLNDNRYGFTIMHCEPDAFGDCPPLIQQYQPEVLILSWPNHNASFAYRCADALRPGGTLIYCGEGRGGCTARDDFFDLLNERFTLNCDESRLLNRYAVRYESFYDSWFVFKKHSPNGGE